MQTFNTYSTHVKKLTARWSHLRRVREGGGRDLDVRHSGEAVHFGFHQRGGGRARAGNLLHLRGFRGRNSREEEREKFRFADHADRLVVFELRKTLVCFVYLIMY